MPAVCCSFIYVACHFLPHRFFSLLLSSLPASLLRPASVLAAGEVNGHLSSNYCVPIALYRCLPSPCLLLLLSAGVFPSHLFLSLFFILGKELTRNKHLLYAWHCPPTLLLRLSFPPFLFGGFFASFITCLLSPEEGNGHVLSTYGVPGSL